MVLLQIRVQYAMANVINSVLSNRRIKKSAIALRASFSALATPDALNVSVCYRFLKVYLVSIVGESIINEKFRKGSRNSDSD